MSFFCEKQNLIAVLGASVWIVTCVDDESVLGNVECKAPFSLSKKFATLHILVGIFNSY
jgi:hypothetical protein